MATVREKIKGSANVFNITILKFLLIKIEKFIFKKKKNLYF